MSYTITEEMRVMMLPGVCTTPACGKWEDSRNSAGMCAQCHNRQYQERKENERVSNLQWKEAGQKYWKDRGIKVGEHVSAWLSSIFSPTGEIVYGIARAGIKGAYVKCHGMKCRADIFDKIKEVA